MGSGRTLGPSAAAESEECPSAQQQQRATWLGNGRSREVIHQADAINIRGLPSSTESSVDGRIVPQGIAGQGRGRNRRELDSEDAIGVGVQKSDAVPENVSLAESTVKEAVR